VVLVAPQGRRADRRFAFREWGEICDAFKRVSLATNPKGSCAGAPTCPAAASTGSAEIPTEADGENDDVGGSAPNDAARPC
jgi:hypothetical protein